MKPILVDAIGINMGGGKTLLNYLVTSLVRRNVDFELIKDVRCPKLADEENVSRVYLMHNSLYNRFWFYVSNRSRYRSVFAFTNCPPLVKMPCPVHTYFHNVNVAKIPRKFPISWKVKNYLKRGLCSMMSVNTDSWIVQTSNTENCLRRTMPTRGKQVYQYPFYHISEEIKQSALKTSGREDYILVGGYTFTRGHDELVEAWKIMAGRGFYPTLHLTVDHSDPFTSVIDEAVSGGAHIINHGIIPFEQISELYGRCLATVYPSINESLGLGIIEAIEAGCDVIGADLPYTYSICKPSVVFHERTPESIADAVMHYAEGKSAKSQLMIDNKIDELIELITK